MPFKVTAAPSLEPITTSELKAYLRFSSSSEDTLLGTLITAARQQIENQTRRPMVTQTLVASFRDWPDSLKIRLPFGNLLTVTSLKYLDEAGAEQTVNSSNYKVITDLQPGQIELIEDFDAPEVYEREDAVYATCTAGYGATAASVPATLRTAVMMLAAYWFEHRIPVQIGDGVNEMPMQLQHLIRSYRVIVTESE